MLLEVKHHMGGQRPCPDKDAFTLSYSLKPASRGVNVAGGERLSRLKESRWIGAERCGSHAEPVWLRPVLRHGAWCAWH